MVRRVVLPPVAVALLACALAGPAAAAKNPRRSVVGQADDRPNVLLIVTDDQRWDTLWAMPNVQHLLVRKGVTFRNGFVVNSLCCPSRATILTGDYSHTTGVYRQISPYGAFASFDDSSTLATWLHEAGYTTALFGKYIDAYEAAALDGYVPPGWDHWEAFAHSQYYNYGLSIDGEVRTFGEEPADYATKVLGADAESFIRSTTGGPLFVVYAPPAPHDPAPPEPRDESRFQDLGPWRPPSWNETDMSDKPDYVQQFRDLTEEHQAAIDRLRTDQYRTLLSVDREVASLVSALHATGRIHDTLIVYLSDNGLLWGEHRWDRKEVPYEESIRIPIIVRYDRLFTGAASVDALALNLDVAPTIADAAGLEPITDGRSLLPLVAGETPPDWRHEFLVEHMKGMNPVPTYCAVRTEDHLYVRYSTHEAELYDLGAYPFELDNRAGDPAMRSV